MAHVATPEVVAPTPAEDDAAAPAIIAPPEDDASNKPPHKGPKTSFPEKLVQLLQEEPDVIRWTREGTIVIPDPAKLESKLPSYFRHQNYSSFQRQLRNFGFNKHDKSASSLNSVYVRVKGEPLADVDVVELLHLRPVLESVAPTGATAQPKATGCWTAEEHDEFLKCLDIYGREWKKIAERITTRTAAQVRTHAQKHFKKVEAGGVLKTAKPATAAAVAVAPAASDAAPPEESDDDEPADVGRRVWALFEPNVWWGGTIITISGVEDERMCRIVFDDGETQTFYVRDVFSSPRLTSRQKVGATTPNAEARAAIAKALSTAAAAAPTAAYTEEAPRRGERVRRPPRETRTAAVARAPEPRRGDPSGRAAGEFALAVGDRVLVGGREGVVAALPDNKFSTWWKVRFDSEARARSVRQGLIEVTRKAPVAAEPAPATVAPARSNPVRLGHGVAPPTRRVRRGTPHARAPPPPPQPPSRELIVGDRVTFGGRTGVVVAQTPGWRKVRLDGEAELRSARRAELVAALDEDEGAEDLSQLQAGLDGLEERVLPIPDRLDDRLAPTRRRALGLFSGKEIEMRRVGDASWRRFGSQTDAGKAFGVAPHDVSDLVRDVPQARLRGLFEARRVAAAVSEPPNAAPDDDAVPYPVDALVEAQWGGGADRAPAAPAPSVPAAWVAAAMALAPPRPPATAPVAAAALVPRAAALAISSWHAGTSDPDADLEAGAVAPRRFGGRAPAAPVPQRWGPPGSRKPVEMRRIGGAEWRWFRSQTDAAKAFSVSPQDISDLVNNSPRTRLREKFEARPACAPPPPRAKKRPRAVAQTAPVESHEPPALVPAVTKGPYDSMPPPPPRAPHWPALLPTIPHALGRARDEAPAPDVGDLVDFRPAAAFGKTLAGAWRRGRCARVHAGKTSSREPTFDVVYDGSTVEPAVRLENIRSVRPFVPATCRRGGRPGALKRRPEIPAKWAAKLATRVLERQVQILTERPGAVANGPYDSMPPPQPRAPPRPALAPYNAVPATSPPVTPRQPSPWLTVKCDYSGASGPRLAKRVRRLSQSRSGSPVGVESTGAALLGKRKAENSRRQFRYHSSGWPSVVAAPDSRPAPVEPLKLPESVLPVRFLETPARSDVTLAMDRMLDHVAPDTKRPKLAEPEDDKGPTVADLAAYLVSRGGNAAQADGWSVGKNPRGDTIYTDSSSGRVFRSKPEVVRFLNVGQA